MMQTLHMNAGSGETSYAKNSSVQVEFHSYTIMYSMNLSYVTYFSLIALLSRVFIKDRFLSFFEIDSFNARMWKVSRQDINV